MPDPNQSPKPVTDFKADFTPPPPSGLKFPGPLPGNVGQPTPSPVPINPVRSSTPSSTNTTQVPEPGLVKIKRPAINLKRTRELIAQMEGILDSKVICYYTAVGSMIHQLHPDLFYDHLQKIGEQKTISLVLISDGGQGTASLRIATILREYCRELQVIVASRCASAATMLALAADKIIMSPAGYLTAIDTSLIHDLNPLGSDRKPVSVSVDQVKRVLKFLEKEGPGKNENGQAEGAYRTLFKYLHPLALGEIDRVSSASELIATKMMRMHTKDFASEEKISEIASRLVAGYPTHAFPILYPEAIEVGLPVEKASKELSSLLWDLTKVYDSATQKAITDISPNFYHFEGFPVIIESLTKRIAHHYVYDKRLNPITRVWQTENDNTGWVKIKFSKTDSKEVVLIPLDIVDTSEQEVKPPETAPQADRLN